MRDSASVVVVEEEELTTNSFMNNVKMDEEIADWPRNFVKEEAFLVKVSKMSFFIDGARRITFSINNKRAVSDSTVVVTREE